MAGRLLLCGGVPGAMPRAQRARICGGQAATPALHCTVMLCSVPHAKIPRHHNIGAVWIGHSATNSLEISSWTRCGDGTKSRTAAGSARSRACWQRCGNCRWGLLSRQPKGVYPPVLIRVVCGVMCRPAGSGQPGLLCHAFSASRRAAHGGWRGRQQQSSLAPRACIRVIACWSTTQPALACLKPLRQAEEAAAWQQLQQAERAAEDLQYERKLHMQSVAAEKDQSTLCLQDAGTRLATELVEEVHAETAETAAAADCQHKSTGEAWGLGEREV